MYGFYKSEPIYLVKIVIKVEAFALPIKENKEEKGELEGKVYAPYFRQFIPKLRIGLFKGSKLIKT